MGKTLAAILAATSLSVFAAQSASAADMPLKAPPPPPPVMSWTGFYLGINGGAGWGTTTSSVDVGKTLALNGINGINLVVPLAQTSLNGYLFGGQAGYNYQVGRYLIGVEGDGDWTNISGTSPCVLVFNCSSKVKWTADFTGRIGFLPLQNLLVYVKGGISWANMDNSFGNSAGASIGGIVLTGAVNANFNETRAGGLLGIGTEYAIDSHWRAKIEYDYADYGSHSSTVPVTASGSVTFPMGPPLVGAVTFPTSVQTQLQLHTVKAGVNYSF